MEQKKNLKIDLKAAVSSASIFHFLLLITIIFCPLLWYYSSHERAKEPSVHLMTLSTLNCPTTQRNSLIPVQKYCPPGVSPNSRFFKRSVVFKSTTTTRSLFPLFSASPLRELSKKILLKTSGAFANPIGVFRVHLSWLAVVVVKHQLPRTSLSFMAYYRKFHFLCGAIRCAK